MAPARPGDGREGVGMRTENGALPPFLVGLAGAQAHYFGKLAQGVFEIPRCMDCGRAHFYPRVCCPHCCSQGLVWIVPSGRGVVHATTVVRRIGGDHNVCLVDLEEGPRLMSRVVDLPAQEVRIGLPVQARVETMRDGPLLVFAPRETA